MVDAFELGSSMGVYLKDIALIGLGIFIAYKVAQKIKKKKKKNETSGTTHKN